MISSISSGLSGSSNTGTAANPNDLGKDQFLTLLTTQLANQSPLEPMDGRDFVAQLAQFSTLEQLTQINQGLDLLHAGQGALLANQAVNLLGKEVVFPGNDIALDDSGNGAPFRYKLDEPAVSVEVTIKDAAGKVVKTLSLDGQTAGLQSEYWNGTDDDGNQLPAGRYTFDVSATNAEGDSVNVETYSMGVVDVVVLDRGYPELKIGSQRISPADILEIGS